MLLKLAWRNIWRNKRRTIITASSIAFAVLFCGFMGAIQEGSWDNMIDNVVASYTGNIQVHKKGYWENPSINDLMEYDASLLSVSQLSEKISFSTPRLESFALISTGENTRGTMIVGIQPDTEDQFTGMADRVVKGNYLKQNDDGALVGDALAELIGVEIGDTIILISQGYHGVNAAGKYPIRGYVHFPTPQFNKAVVILNLTSAQQFYGAEDLVSAVVIKAEKIETEEKIVTDMTQGLDTSAYEIMTYKELMPDLIKSKQVDSAGNYIIFFVLYMIIAFGIFGTILMMMKERQYEFGVLISIGMEKIKLFMMVWLELLMLVTLGVLIGIVLAFSVSYYFHVNPIVLTGEFAQAMENFEFEPVMPASIELWIFILQAIIVYGICIAIIIFPYFHLKKLEPVKALRE
jgi:ABC-type lipoprotein release transport system permease subunit